MRDEYIDSMDRKSELSYHHFNPTMIEAIREDYNDGYPWKWDKDYKKPGPKEQAVIDDITQKKAAIQQELIDYAKELGIEDDIMNLNRPKVFPDMMRSTWSLLSLTLKTIQNTKRFLTHITILYGERKYNNERFPQRTPYDLQTIYNLFPSLQYGLIPKEALELKENYDGRNLKIQITQNEKNIQGQRMGYRGRWFASSNKNRSL